MVIVWVALNAVLILEDRLMPVVARAALIVAAALSVSCSRTPAASNTATNAGSAAKASAPASPADSTDAAPPEPNASAGTVSGPVVETMDAGSYTYVRVKSGADDVWAATGRFKVQVGDRVTVPLEMPMRDFHSKALDRDFPLIYFASAIVPEGQPIESAAAARDTMRPMDNHSPDTPEVVTERMPPAAGVTPVAHLWAERAALAGKPVTVRGKVVKYNGGIMGLNWLHIQDGTGTAGGKNNDVAVTTSDPAAVGETVTATGIVGVDRDFGAGYSYPVIVEKATLRKP